MVFPPLPHLYRYEQRPWGGYAPLISCAFFKAKRIDILPGQKLSLQRHAFRDERWLVSRGAGHWQIDAKRLPCRRGDMLSVPRGAEHRIENTGGAPLSVIEVQTGPLLCESDIIRIADIYGRPCQAARL